MVLYCTVHRFVDYNFREYTQRRARYGFRKLMNESDPIKAQQAYTQAQQQYKVLERQVLINSLYSKGDFVIERVGGVHRHHHPAAVAQQGGSAISETRIRGTDVRGRASEFTASPRIGDTQLDSRTSLENRKVPDHYASKDIKEASTSIPA
jgi:hypothetical protein